MSNIFKRTNMCGELRLSDEGKSVILNGWVAKQRSLGGLIFVDIRDKSGITQIVINENAKDELIKIAKSLRSEFVIGVKGIVRERDSKNTAIDTGDIEIVADDIIIYSKAETPPIYIKDDDNASDSLRLKYRYLDLRKNKMQNNLSTRHKVCKIARDYFDDNNFTEVETPYLIKPTPEGARDYLVPSRIKQGSFYALPQSPQMYKQLLMIGGTDRYYQIVKCFRDEDLRADRQPEFTQIDLEMSFVDQDEVIKIQEGFLKKLMKEIKGIELQLPLPRLSWQEAMVRFGSDKPDTRFGSELVGLSEELKDTSFKIFSDNLMNGGDIRGICIPNGAKEFSRKKIDKLTLEAKQYGAKGIVWIKKEEGKFNSSVNKFFDEKELEILMNKCAKGAEINPIPMKEDSTSDRRAEDGDIVFICSDKPKIVYDSLGFLRRRANELLGKIDQNKFNFLWVVDFPMFEINDDGNISAMHHPFTKPKIDEISQIDENDILSLKADAYDIVLNGIELGGGSIRIHDSIMQAKMFDILGLSEEECEEKFGFLINALKYGAPPHAGLAYGLDRMVMLLLGEDSIREVIAFPKNQNAEEPVSNAPAHSSSEQLNELGLELINND